MTSYDNWKTTDPRWNEMGNAKQLGNRFRCEDGNLMRHNPQHDDPELETNVGQCPECRGKGCSDEEDGGRR